jgi:membrane associated rhomboid family serine protease
MGLHNRTYWKEDQGGGGVYGGGGGGGFGGGMHAGRMPKPGPAVKALLIANVVMFFLQLLPNVNEHLTLVPVRWWFVWNYITFQFLHGGPMHLLFNMLGLYFLGMVLERAWGSKRFVIFYLSCGVFAGICHVVMTFAMGGFTSIPLLGASGGVYGIVVACAILFPQIRLVLLFFLVPIRFAALLFLGVAVYSMLQGGAGGGVAHAAHLGGAVMAAIWVWVLPRFKGAAEDASLKRKQGAWDRKMKQRADEQGAIDRILDKIKLDGLNSLTRKEKQTLQQATKRQQAEEDRAHRL